MLNTTVTTVSIIVPCRNEVRSIGGFLESLLAQDMSGLTWEAIIVDGMSGDGTREVVEPYRRRYPTIKLIDNPTQIVSTALNAAIQASNGEVIIRMDAHSEYAPDYVQCCVRVMRETGADNVGGPVLACGSGLIGRAIATGYHSPFACGGARFHDKKYEGLVDTVPYGCWRRSVFARVGLFDPELARNQDDEFNLRLTRAGGRVWQSPRIVSWYQPRNSINKLFHQYFQYGFWKVAVIRKHGRPASWRHLVPGIFVLVNLLLPVAVFASFEFGGRNLARCSTALWISEVLTYALACLAAAGRAASREGWRLLAVLPIVFLTFHISYGAGFLLGAGHFSFQSERRGSTIPPQFSELSR